MRHRFEGELPGICARLLGTASVPPDAELAELGGDSTFAMRLVLEARARGHGLQIDQVRSARTLTELQRALLSSPTARSSARVASGPVCMIPPQVWFLGWLRKEREFWNLTGCLELARPVAADALDAAVRAVELHHEALRLRFRKGADGWSAEVAEQATVAVDHLRLGGVTEQARATTVNAWFAAAHESIDLEAGPLLRVAYVDRGEARPLVLVVVSHLVFDQYSWWVVLDDLETACEQAASGRTIELAPCPVSYQAWTRRFSELADSPLLESESEHWLAPEWQDIEDMPVDFEEGPHLFSSTLAADWTLDAQETIELLRAARRPPACGAFVLVMAAFARAYARWGERRTLLMETLDSGREPSLTGLDLSRTVGSIAHSYPLRLEIGPDLSAEAVLDQIGRQARRVPHRGLACRLTSIRTDRASGERITGGLPGPPISFNYQGRLTSVYGSTLFARRVHHLCNPRMGPEDRFERTKLLDVEVVMQDDGLSAGLYFSSDRYRPDSMARLADLFRESVRDLVRQRLLAVPPLGLRPRLC